MEALWHHTPFMKNSVFIGAGKPALSKENQLKMKEDRTVIKGFYNKKEEETHEEEHEMVPQNCEPEEVNVTWIFWLLGGLSVSALAMSIISLIIVCN